ncbi:MAG: nucleotidyltransferase domain-containing protein [Thermoplasmatales archaeon]|nr:nucleotidyltransferase domain-containing protein [Thermoplasmatales archaeon]
MSKIPQLPLDGGFDYSKADEVCQRIVETFRPERITVFGSVAKGLANEDSDLDMVVVMRTDLPYMERSVAIYGSIDELRMATDILVFTPEEYDDGLRDGNTFIGRIDSEGVEVYALHTK